jgi:membrane protein
MTDPTAPAPQAARRRGGVRAGPDPQEDQPCGDGARGRRAWRPWRIPAKGWRDILSRVGERMAREYVPLMAAGIAFFALLALFPALAALISIAGFIFEPGIVPRQLAELDLILPPAAADLVRDQAEALSERASGGRLGLAAAISLGLAAFIASRGVNNLIDGINMAHAEPETRGMIRRNLVAFALTGTLAGLALLALGLTVIAPLAIAALGLEGVADLIVTWGRWPVMMALVMAALALLYRYAPARRPPRWSWATPGAVLATAVWLLVSFLFSLYVRNGASYGETYGAIGGVVVLLLWMWLTSLVVLVGAHLNAEMEHQTRRDTTRGRPRPMGERGAFMADTLGRRR